MPGLISQDRMAAPEVGTGLAAFIKRHPVTTFFVLAFLGTWLLFIPILLSGRGLGLIEIPDGLGFALFILSTYAGPFLGGWIVTRVVDGAAGVRARFRRIVQWRVNWFWYVLVLVGYPIAFGLPAIFMEGQSALTAAQQNLGNFLPNYLAAILIGFFAPTLGEEAGWRGFALTRLQPSRGPMAATLIVSVVHAVWHLPAYFIRDAITSTGEFSPVLFAANSLAIIAASFVWTWLFNHGGGSILFATFVHAASNGMSSNLPAWLNLQDSSPWYAFGVLAVLAVLVIVFTRGRLGQSIDDQAHGRVTAA